VYWRKANQTSVAGWAGHQIRGDVPQGVLPEVPAVHRLSIVAHCFRGCVGGLLVIVSLRTCLWAQTVPAPEPAPSPDSAALPTIEVTGAKHPKTSAVKPRATPTAVTAVPALLPSSYQTGAPNIAGGARVPPSMASQMTISGQDLNTRPVTRPGEILEAAPGLAVVTHADGGKANQYYLRGYNLDHGTDLAIFVDGMPINLPTHAHGQGYADLNWLMPETVNSLDIRKGPYFADAGDFANAGTLSINLRDSVEQRILEATYGSFARTDQATYAYGSLLKTDSLFAMCFPAHGPPTTPAAVCQNGVMDYVLHPIEPLAVRLTVAAAF
jgi:hypothetical protein